MTQKVNRFVLRVLRTNILCEWLIKYLKNDFKTLLFEKNIISVLFQDVSQTGVISQTVLAVLNLISQDTVLLSHVFKNMCIKCICFWTILNLVIPSEMYCFLWLIRFTRHNKIDDSPCVSTGKWSILTNKMS